MNILVSQYLKAPEILSPGFKGTPHW